MTFITAITCTTGRQSFYHTRDYLLSQSVGPHQWIVVQNGVRHEVLSDLEGVDCFVWRRDPEALQNRPGGLARNILAAIPHVRGDLVFFFEDDDWYHHRWIEEVLWNYEQDLARENDCRIYGQMGWYYYNLPTQMYQDRNSSEPIYKYATMAATAVTDMAIPELKSACERSYATNKKGIDAMLWRSLTVAGMAAPLDFSSPMVVGIKGYDGQVNLGVGGKPDPKTWELDHSGEKLREWIGMDIKRYMDTEV